VYGDFHDKLPCVCAFTRAYTHQVSHTRPHTITHTHLHTRKNTHTHTSKYTQMRAGWLCMCVPFTCLGLQDPDVRVVGSPPPGVCTCVRLWLVCVCVRVCVCGWCACVHVCVYVCVGVFMLVCAVCGNVCVAHLHGYSKLQSLLGRPTTTATSCVFCVFCLVAYA